MEHEDAASMKHARLLLQVALQTWRTLDALDRAVADGLLAVEKVTLSQVARNAMKATEKWIDAYDAGCRKGCK